MDCFVSIEKKTLPTDMEEARRAMEIADKKLSENDYNGAKKLITKAQSLYPNLEGLNQRLTMINVYISASNREGEADWYGILGVDPLDDDEVVKKSYKHLALLLHPDKNKCNGAEGAFKLVSEAWCLLSDKVQRTSYDQRRKSKEANTKMQKSSNQQEPASSTRAKARSTKDDSADSSNQKEIRMFWTMCRRCKTQCNLRDSNLNKAILCPNCHQTFIATDKTSKAPNKNTKKAPQQQQQQWSVQNQEPNKSTKNTSFSGINSTPSVTFTWKCSSRSCSSVSFKVKSAANQRPKRRLEAQEMVSPAEKILKKQRTYMR